MLAGDGSQTIFHNWDAFINNSLEGRPPLLADEAVGVFPFGDAGHLQADTAFFKKMNATQGCGHPGGIGTIHAGTAIGALRRLEQLIQEAVVTVPRALIAETIDLVAVLSGRGAARRLAELARVEGLAPDGDYRITPATAGTAGDHA